MNDTTENNNMGLTEAIKTLCGQSLQMPVKEVLGNLKSNTAYSHLIVDYRKVYNTMKRISKTSKTQVVIDLNNISPAKVEE